MEQSHHLFAVRALMHILPIAHDDDAGQLFGRALREEADGGGHVLQIDSGIQQSFGNGKNHHIFE